MMTRRGKWNVCVWSRGHRLPAGIVFAKMSIILAMGCTSGYADALVSITAPTTDWKAIVYPGLVNPDPSHDQQTGSAEGDLVGNAENAAFYLQFGDAGTLSTTDGTLAFRARLGMDKNPAGFATCLFVGMDANADGALDLFLGVNNSGSADQLGIWDPGTGANTSPNTTTISSPALISYAQTAGNYAWQPVTSVNDPSATSYDIDGGGSTDYFLSFSIPFADVVSVLNSQGISIEQNTHVRYVMATATQANSLNQDLNGVSGSVNSSLTWAELGAITAPITPTGQLPEPSVGILVLGGLGVFALRRRSQFRPACEP